MLKGLMYTNSNDSVQGSFEYQSHENLTIDAVASTSEAINGGSAILSMAVGAHVKIGSGDATVADFVLPAGVWHLLVEKGHTISVLKLTDSDSGQASIIIPTR